MKRDGPRNIVASVQAHLVQRSRELGVEHQVTLARFGGERLLYRLSKSEFADRFILKGAALLLLWPGETIRPTKDIDLLGFGDTSADALKRVFVSLCTVEAPEDGLTFLSESVHVEAIRESQEYGGMRIKLLAMLGNVRIPLQVDVGAGDAGVPPAEVLDYPSLLDLPRARIRAYRPETAIDDLYRRWIKHGDEAFNSASSTALAEALETGAGRVESFVLPYAYHHLSPLVGQSRSTGADVEKGVEKRAHEGDTGRRRSQPRPSTPWPLRERSVVM